MAEKEVIVLSLGGSLIVPEEPDLKYIHKFKQTLRKNYNKYKFVIVCGGGTIARRYISLLEKEHKNKREISEAGIKATRTNATILMQLFGKEANNSLPMDMHEVKNNLKENNVVICGALRFTPNSTSDSTATRLAHFLNSRFINITNVLGLYNKDPRKHKDAKLIKTITWKEFNNIAKKIKYKAGQHFVLDQRAAKEIEKYSIWTAILGNSTKELEKAIKKQKFIGTTISN